jgi:hypothetical protein
MAFKNPVDAPDQQESLAERSTHENAPSSKLEFSGQTGYKLLPPNSSAVYKAGLLNCR